jgi:hypothetical protein
MTAPTPYNFPAGPRVTAAMTAASKVQPLRKPKSIRRIPISRNGLRDKYGLERLETAARTQRDEGASVSALKTEMLAAVPGSSGETPEAPSISKGDQPAEQQK